MLAEIRSTQSPEDAAARLLAAARAILPWLVEIRRDLHQHPELGLEEHRTSGRVQELLDGLGIEHVDGLGGTGVLGQLEPAAHGGEPVLHRARRVLVEPLERASRSVRVAVVEREAPTE